jgi:hypothetical protein
MNGNFREAGIAGRCRIVKVSTTVSVADAGSIVARRQWRAIIPPDGLSGISTAGAAPTTVTNNAANIHPEYT